MHNRGLNKKTYHYKVINKLNDEFKYYKTCDEITKDYGISRANIYLMAKNPNIIRRKYNNINIEKCHLHYLVVEQGLDPEAIKF
tara:strand:- start:2768 stop:3019 length:252 start_codon:yes stop_codon:yes gene_type:complete